MGQVSATSVAGVTNTADAFDRCSVLGMRFRVVSVGGRLRMAKAEDEPQVQLATRIPKRLHRELRLHCVNADVTVMDFVVEALREKLAKAGGRKRAGRDA
jgi:hypothetical protein